MLVTPPDREGWDDLNVEEERISWGVTPCVFVVGLQGNQLAALLGWGRRPGKFKEPVPPLCRGQTTARGRRQRQRHTPCLFAFWPQKHIEFDGPTRKMSGAENRTDETETIITPRQCRADMNIQRFIPRWLWLRFYTFKARKCYTEGYESPEEEYYVWKRCMGCGGWQTAREGSLWNKKKLLVLSATPAGILYIAQYSNPQVSLELLYWTVDFQTENAG